MRISMLIGIMVATPASASAPPDVRAFAETILGSAFELRECQAVEREGWPSGLISRCVYEVTDEAETAARTYQAAVWLADPSKGRVAEWAWTACDKAQTDSPRRCAKQVIRHIREASSAGHFPVAGLFYEDICDPKRPEGERCQGTPDGRYEARMFRDGVTSKLDGFAGVNGSAWPPAGTNGIDASERVATADVTGMATGKVRPTSLTPAEYARASPESQVPADISNAEDAKLWLSIIRAGYAKALAGPEEGSENPFVTAWVCLHKQSAVVPSVCFSRHPVATGPSSEGSGGLWTGMQRSP